MIYSTLSIVLVMSLLSSTRVNPTYISNHSTPLTNSHVISFQDITLRNRTFNITGSDLLVLLHIQKTSGTALEKHLVNHFNISLPCSCDVHIRRCSCLRSTTRKLTTYADSTWLISRFSTGWICGLHPDWTHLTHCLQNLDNLFFATYLRHPLYRFVSEYRHVRRGATWKASKKLCNVYSTENCFKDRNDWSDVSIEEFVDCSSNMAINRQTLMLADHRLLTCLEDSLTRDRILLSSAIKNLKTIAFFGICEQQRKSQFVFEKTFGTNFNLNFVQSEDNQTKTVVESLSQEVRQKILDLNKLDLQLYEFALKLFEHRLHLLDSTLLKN